MDSNILTMLVCEITLKGIFIKVGLISLLKYKKIAILYLLILLKFNYLMIHWNCNKDSVELFKYSARRKAVCDGSRNLQLLSRSGSAINRLRNYQAF